MKQCKDKLRNLKDAYKIACDSNKQTGAEPKFSPYYEIFDEVYGTRDVINMPNLLDSGKEKVKPKSKNKPIQPEDNVTELNNTQRTSAENSLEFYEEVEGIEYSDEETDLLDVTEDEKNEENVMSTPEQLKKSSKKPKAKPFREELMELQNKQLEAFKEQTSRSELCMQQLFSQSDQLVVTMGSNHHCSKYSYWNLELLWLKFLK